VSGLPGVVAVPTRRRAQLVQDQALAGLVGALVPGRVCLCDRLPLHHRQSDHPGLTARPEPVPQARPTRAFLRESHDHPHARIFDESTRGVDMPRDLLQNHRDGTAAPVKMFTTGDNALRMLAQCTQAMKWSPTRARTVATSAG